MGQTKGPIDAMTRGQSVTEPVLAQAADPMREQPDAIHVKEHGQDHEHAHIESSDILRILFTAIIAALVWFRTWEPFPHLSLLGITGILIGGYPIFQEAFENVRERRMTMELSMTIALVAAACIGEFFTALVITLFVLIAEVLEGLTVARGRRAIGDLLDLLPRSAWIVQYGRTFEVLVRDLRPGDRVLIRPGTRVPVDGHVVSGSSSRSEE